MCVFSLVLSVLASHRSDGSVYFCSIQNQPVWSIQKMTQRRNEKKRFFFPFKRRFLMKYIANSIGSGAWCLNWIFWINSIGVNRKKTVLHTQSHNNTPIIWCFRAKNRYRFVITNRTIYDIVSNCTRILSVYSCCYISVQILQFWWNFDKKYVNGLLILTIS